MHFEVLQRKGVNPQPHPPTESQSWYTLHPDIALEDISSTAARSTKDPRVLSSIVTSSVCSFIVNNHLYLFRD